MDARFGRVPRSRRWLLRRHDVAPSSAAADRFHPSHLLVPAPGRQQFRRPGLDNERPLGTAVEPVAAHVVWPVPAEAGAEGGARGEGRGARDGQGSAPRANDELYSVARPSALAPRPFQRRFARVAAAVQLRHSSGADEPARRATVCDRPEGLDHQRRP